MIPTSDRLPRVWAVPLVLLFLSFLSYGLLIPRLGFYWDDWPGVLVSHSLGARGLIGYTAASRPSEGWLFAVTTALLGEAPLRWHVLALLTRWLSAVAVWWCLRGLWPERTREVAGVAILFAVYPGFTVQPMAWIHSQGYFVPLVLFFLSLGSMVWAQRAPRLFWPLTALALLSSALSMMLVEHFVGLELLRPALIWLVLSEQMAGARGRLRRALRNWAPYLAVVGAFSFWRLFLFKTSVAFLDQSSYFKSIAAHPLFALQSRARKALLDVIESSLMAWGQTFRPEIFNFDSPDSRSLWAAAALVLVSAAAVIVYLTRLEPRAGAGPETYVTDDAGWAKRAITL